MGHAIRRGWLSAPSWVGLGQPADLPSLDSQVPPGGNKTQYEEIGIPVALLSYKDMLDIFKVGVPPPEVCWARGLNRWWAGPVARPSCLGLARVGLAHYEAATS